MWWYASEINGYAIDASDGRLGAVSDFLFEDASWMIRWLVVDTGHWLSGRKVLLPPSVLEQPDAGRRQFPVKLTMQQVKDSPDVDTDRPVSRQLESHIYNHYAWDPYWGSGYMWGAIATPIAAPPFLSDPLPRDPIDVDVDARPNEDPHLRSIAEVIGYHIHATDGELGHVEDFLLDDAGWGIRYVAVDTRNWWPGKKVLISPRSVREIDWANRLMHLDVDRQKVKDSPAYDPTMTVDQTYEERFHDHYGGGWPGS